VTISYHCVTSEESKRASWYNDEAFNTCILPGAEKREYRFVGINTPNLLRLEVNASNSLETAVPSAEEIWDLLCGVQQMGARVARTYVLSFCDDGYCHISNGPYNASVGTRSLVYNETWFYAMDSAINTANELGIRLTIPFINMINLKQVEIVKSPRCSTMLIAAKSFFL